MFVDVLEEVLVCFVCAEIDACYNWVYHLYRWYDVAFFLRLGDDLGILLEHLVFQGCCQVLNILDLSFVVEFKISSKELSTGLFWCFARLTRLISKFLNKFLIYGEKGIWIVLKCLCLLLGSSHIIVKDLIENGLLGLSKYFKQEDKISAFF